VKLEEQREEEAPLTQLHSKEQIEMLRKATTHGKNLATRGGHVMNNDFFVAAETNLN
jgi:hypothetical protein